MGRSLRRRGARRVRGPLRRAHGAQLSRASSAMARADDRPLLAFVRFQPHRRRTTAEYPFREMLVQLFGAVTTLTGTPASRSSPSAPTDDRATSSRSSRCCPSDSPRPASTSSAPASAGSGAKRRAPPSTTFGQAAQALRGPALLPRAVPSEARPLYVTGAHFARGSFAVMPSDGRAALESADALDAAGLKLYAMIASQIRFLYYMNRGELSKAAPHREQVELHAAHVGCAWQVETWEGGAPHPALHEPVRRRVADPHHRPPRGA